MLTVDLDRLGLRAGDRALDLGCGGGRHAFALFRRGVDVVALDLSASDVAEVNQMLAAMRLAGEVPGHTQAAAMRGDARKLPFPDGAFDAVVLSEVLEHIPEDRRVIAEATRVLRPGGTIAVTVPRWWPERLCWALSTAYHEVEGGHIRIYRRGQLRARLREAALDLRGSHHAHALHSPYWWLRCLFGTDNEGALLPRAYHRMLVHDIMHRPWWTRWTETALNPVLGKSLVCYATKPESA